MEEERGLERLDRAVAGVELVSDRPTIVTALPLKEAAREHLARLLGARVVDVRDPCDDPDIVLSPSSSPQLIDALKQQYDGARIVVVELDDWDLDIELGGPVKRLLRAGADAYLVADSVDELAGKLRAAPTSSPDEPTASPAELPEGATVDDLVAAFLRDAVAGREARAERREDER